MCMLFTALLLFAQLQLVAQNPAGYQSTHFTYEGDDAKIIKALKDADAILARPDFWQALRAYPQQRIDNSTYTMVQLADTLQLKPCVAQVIYTSSLFQSATAQTGRLPEQPATITLQGPGYDQSAQDLAVTFVHEWVHAVDYALHCRLVNGVWQTNLKFAHFGEPNRCQGRCPSRDTASYRVERVVEVLLGEGDYALTDCTEPPGIIRRRISGTRQCE